MIAMEGLLIIALAIILTRMRSPTSVTDDRFGHLGEACHVCGYAAHEPWHKDGDCWYQSA